MFQYSIIFLMLINFSRGGIILNSVNATPHQIIYQNNEPDVTEFNSGWKTEADKRLEKLENNLTQLWDGFNTLAEGYFFISGRTQNVSDQLQNFKKDILEKLNEAPTNNLKVKEFSCQKQEVRGYNRYGTVHKIGSSTFYNAKLQKNEKGIKYFEMNFSVMALNTGILMLSSMPDAGYDAHVFEIVIGENGGNYTELLTNKDSNGTRTLVETPSILSPTQFTDFYVAILYGNLQIGERGQPAFLNYKDEDLKSMKYFSFATRGDNTATFLFDCPDYEH